MSDISPDDPRVRLAEDRTILAAERTYASWLRTGLAFLGAGLAAQHFLAGSMAGWALRLLALALIACGTACFGLAVWRDHTLRRHLGSAQVPLISRAVTLGLALILGAVSGLSAVMLWWA